MPGNLSERAFEVCRYLELAKDYYDPNPDRNHISGLQHALRLATLLDNLPMNYEDRYWLSFAGLVHDLARPLNDIFHGEIIAEVVRDRVPPYIYHLLRTHGLYQEALIHKTEYPKIPHGIEEICKPYDLEYLALMFAGQEAFTFSPDYRYSSQEQWSFGKGRVRIAEILA